MTETQTSEEQQHSTPHIVVLCVQAFLLMVTYALARPATEALVLTKFGSKSLPQIWIAVAIAVVLAVSFYNRYVSKIPLIRLFGLTIGVSGALLLSMLALKDVLPGISLFLYVWKEIYIVLLVEIFWSIANVIFPFRTAKWVYGLFGAMGSLGGIVGNLGVGVLAKKMGTTNTLWLILPVFALSWLLIYYFTSTVGDVALEDKKKDTNLRTGLETVRNSSYLLLVLFVILVSQIVVNFIDFQFKQMVEVSYGGTAQRALVIGRVYAAIDAGTIVLNLLTGVILARLGLAFSLLSIPAILAATATAFALVPQFLTIAISKAASKITTYSLFKAAKEILYIPLNYEEKTQGKAVVDVLTYRAAKGVASILLWGMLSLGLRSWINGALVFFLLVWGWLTFQILKRYKEREPVDAEVGDS